LPVPLVEDAPAKVNLTLRVLGRRTDGYHEISSLVVFADVGDRLTLTPGDEFSLAVSGPQAAQAGDPGANLVFKAAHALKERIAGIKLGAFQLEKNLPVAAGLGGGSADAAATLRLLARANDLPPGDPRLAAAARATGADVPVCLDPQPRLMWGIGEKLSPPLTVPPLAAVLVNPGAALVTKLVFAGWTAAVDPASPFDPAAVEKARDQDQFFEILARQTNDLEAAAVKLAPVVADVLAALRRFAGCRLARMSGSGSTCFALFDSVAAADSAADALRGEYPRWWIRACRLGDAAKPGKN
jgi:4-diphosphocytidyl-2-C-methyl-D-erythritol kinase